MAAVIVRMLRAILDSKFKVLVALMSMLVFLLVLFPINDLGDFVSTQVAKLTRNQVFLQFEELQMSLFPSPGMKVRQVYVEGPTIPAISAQEIKFAPSISALIAQQP